MIRDEDIFLTIYCQCYNFGEYLRDAFEGFVAQKTSFRFRVFVYDDASTDDSSEIIKEYAEKYPEIFDIYISEKNMYNEPNRIDFLQTLKKQHVRGKYFAACEGDDYWIDPYKLQKQVDFLEKHPECSMVVHASHWINYSTNIEYDYHPYSESRYLTAEEVILQLGGNPSTASQVYRTRDLFADSDNTVIHVGDYTTQLYSLTRGKIYYMDEVMSVYRHQHEGSWSVRYARNKKYAMISNRRVQVFLEKYDRDTGYRFHEYVYTRFLSYFYDPMLLDNSVSMHEYELTFSEWEEESGYSFDEYKEDIKRIGEISRGIYKLSESQLALIRGSEKLVIFGCGEYSRIIRNMIESNGLVVDGYLISDDQEGKKSIDGKEVWKMREYPFDYSKSVIFLGLSQKYEYEIKRVLKRYHAERVMDDFWIKASKNKEK